MYFAWKGFEVQIMQEKCSYATVPVICIRDYAACMQCAIELRSYHECFIIGTVCLIALGQRP